MYIDSNIFLEVLLKQDRSEECKEFLGKIIKGDILCSVSNFNIDNILLNIENKTKDHKIMNDFLLSIVTYSGLSIYFLTIEDRLKALEHMKNHKLDFEDAMTLQAALASGNTAIVSFDKHFDKVPIKRVEPKDVLEQ